MDDREKRLNFAHLGIFPRLKETEAIQLLEDITDLYYDAFPRTRYDQLYCDGTNFLMDFLHDELLVIANQHLNQKSVKVLSEMMKDYGMQHFHEVLIEVFQIS